MTGTEYTARVILGRGIVGGTAAGRLLVSQTAVSFLGDIDIRSGRVVGAACDLQGKTVSGRVLVVPATRGSAGAWRFIFQLRQHGTHPAALLTRALPDPSVVQGAILAELPLVSGIDPDAVAELAGNQAVRVDGDMGTITAIR